jgi:hypothetical protein
MNRHQFQTKVHELVERAGPELEAAALHLFASGGVDTDFYDEDGYVLPKMALSVVLEDLATRWVPQFPYQRNDYHNLRKV